MNTNALATEGLGLQSKRVPLTLDVTVLMGGPSAERDVSIMTGTAIAEGLESLGHRVTRADISPDDTSALDREGMDMVFIALHGEFGESGQVQAMCEQRGLRYTGSPPRASALAMDKAVSAELFTGAGLRAPRGMVVYSTDEQDQVAAALNRLPLPVVVKPVDSGSSVDITIAPNAVSRDVAVEGLLEKYGRAMVEEFIPGREFTVGILGGRPLPVLEVVPAREFYDYAAKYSDDSGTQYVFDHGMPVPAAEEMQSAAMKAHGVLGCRDMSRVDFILTPDNEPVVLEVNTIPGFTSHSLLPMAAAKAGISFPQLVQQIALMAMQR